MLILLTPWISVEGVGLLRIDLASLTIHFGGQILRIEELYLLLIFSLLFGVAFLLITMVFGRVWCGWACPQTTLTDLADGFCQLVGLTNERNRLQGTLVRKLLAHLFFLLLALLVGANLVWYFVPPQRFFSELLQGTLHTGAGISWASITLIVYLDLALIRRLMCSDFCPYGRFQTALADEGTLTLHLPVEESYRCIECNSCVNVCPMSIDIREGFQIECINCGRCLDACRKIMAPGKQPGLIYYHFGTEGHGVRALFNPRTLLLGLVTIVLTVTLLYSVSHRQTVSLKVSVSHLVAARILPDGQLATFFNTWVNNRSAEPASYRLIARTTPEHSPLTLRGQSLELNLKPGENQKLDVVLLSENNPNGVDVEFVLIDNSNQATALTAARVTPVDRSSN